MTLHVCHPHHGHSVKPEYVKEMYTCNSCKLVGFGKRYSCPMEKCDFHIHDVCVNPQISMKHPLLRDENLKFSSYAGHANRHLCVACGIQISGSSFCTASSDSEINHPTTLFLHTYCALSLEHKLSKGQGVPELALQKKLSSECRFCGLKELANGLESWCYVSQDEKQSYQFHMFCGNKKLLENWEYLTMGVDRQGVPIGKGETLHQHLKDLLFDLVPTDPSA